MNESLVKYLAGLLDADGSLSFNFKRDQNRKDRQFVGVTLNLASSTAVDTHGFVPTLPEITGMGTISRYGKNQQFVTWAINKRADLERLLPRLIKHMVIKAQHWQWLLDTWRSIRQDNKTVSNDEAELLKEASKHSRRIRIGPIKPKNHPTWAWLSGYMDGDGCYSYRRNYVKTRGNWQWTIKMEAVAHVNDVQVLEFLKSALGGTIRQQNKSGTVFVWRLALGYRNRSKALSILPKLAKHSRLKRIKIDSIINHHQQRLSKPGTGGGRIQPPVQAIV